MTLLATHTISAAATYDIPLQANWTNAFGVYLVFDLTCSTDIVDMYARYTTDNFSTVKSGASDYSYISSGTPSTGSRFDVGASNTDRIGIPRSDGVGQLGDQADEGLRGALNIRHFNSSTFKTVGFGSYLIYSRTGTFLQTLGGNIYNTAEVTNGIRLYVTSGTFSGTVRIYSLNTATLANTVTLSGGETNFDIPFPASTPFFRIKLRNIRPNTDNTLLHANFTNDNFSTVLTGTGHQYSSHSNIGLGTRSSNDTKIVLANSLGNASDRLLTGYVEVFSATNAAARTYLGCDFQQDPTGSTAGYSLQSFGMSGATGTTNGIRLTLSSGTFAAGIAEVYTL